jgi:hypothetical protein
VVVGPLVFDGGAASSLRPALPPSSSDGGYDVGWLIQRTPLHSDELEVLSLAFGEILGHDFWSARYIAEACYPSAPDILGCFHWIPHP